MSEGWVSAAWRFSVLSMILLLSSAGLVLAYAGMLDAIALQPTALARWTGTLLCGSGAWWLAQSRNDLVGI